MTTTILKTGLENELARANTVYGPAHPFYLLLSTLLSLFRGYRDLFVSTSAAVPLNLKMATLLLHYHPSYTPFSPTIFKHWVCNVCNKSGKIYMFLKCFFNNSQGLWSLLLTIFGNRWKERSPICTVGHTCHRMGARAHSVMYSYLYGACTPKAIWGNVLVIRWRPQMHSSLRWGLREAGSHRNPNRIPGLLFNILRMWDREWKNKNYLKIPAKSCPAFSRQPRALVVQTDSLADN